MKKILITGANSYVGTNVEKWLLKDKYKSKEIIEYSKKINESKKYKEILKRDVYGI